MTHQTKQVCDGCGSDRRPVHRAPDGLKYCSRCYMKVTRPPVEDR